MAEFSEVMRQFDRMCKSHAGCVDCPLAIKGSVETKCSIGSFIDDSEYVEREIMAWAAEHPEPVYPTWWEWLENMGIVSKPKSECSKIFDTTRMYDNIPADFAQKHGIEPLPKA